MKITITLKRGRVLQFHEQPYTIDTVDDKYIYAKGSKGNMIFHCTNGTFFVDPNNIECMHMETDHQEKD